MKWADLNMRQWIEAGLVILASGGNHASVNRDVCPEQDAVIRPEWLPDGDVLPDLVASDLVPVEGNKEG